MTSNTICPYCKYEATNHETLGNQKNHKKGDISFCINCGEISKFKNHGLIKINLNSLDESIKQQINDIRVAWLRRRAISKVQRG